MAELTGHTGAARLTHVHARQPLLGTGRRGCSASLGVGRASLARSFLIAATP